MRNQPRSTEAIRPVLSPAGQTQGNMVIRVPIKFKRDDGRKEVIAPSGLEGEVVLSRPPTQSALVLALARAHHWVGMLERGEIGSIGELARRWGTESSRVGKILRLTTLAPDIIQAILAGQEPDGVSLRQLIASPPVGWGEQRRRHGFAATLGEDASGTRKD
jgi:hypothetical protein